MTDDTLNSLAISTDLAHVIEHDRMLVLARITKFLRQVAFADQDRADARHVLEDVAQVVDAFEVLDHQDDEKFAFRIERPDVCLLVVLLL